MIKTSSIILLVALSCPLRQCLQVPSRLSKLFMSINTVGTSNNNTKRIILGSGSKSRLDIIEAEGFKVEVMKADIDEKSIGCRKDASAADNLVTSIAIAKADAILEFLKNNTSFQELEDKSTQLLLTADQVVVHKSEILEKPNDLEQARKYIESYANNQCSTIGSIVVTNVSSGKRKYGVATSTIHFGAIPSDVIDKLLKEPMLLNCAGGLMVEHPLVQPYILRVDGSYNSLMGLCTDLLYSLLRELEE